VTGGQGRTPDELAESAAVCLWCFGGMVVLFALAYLGVGR